MTVTIKRGKASGTASAPPSKSFAHRMLICAALSSGGGSVKGISESEDMSATLDCLNALGAQFEKKDGTVIFKKGVGGAEAPVLNCRESGSTLRFFMPLACVLCGGAVFKGTERLMQRGTEVYDELFEENGISVSRESDCVTLKGSLKAGTYSVRGDVSSQYITGLLLALPLLSGDSVLRVIPPVESRAYIDITLSVLKTFGIEISESEQNTFYIRGGQSYSGCSAVVEGDWSNAAFLALFNRLGGAVTLSGLNYESIQGDRICLELFEKIANGEENIDISNCPDLGPVLFAYAAAAGGGSFCGTRRLHIKESDRVFAMASELAHFGITVAEEGDHVRVAGRLSPPDGPLYGHNDHRIVMALSVLLTLTGGTISDAQAINKSFPDFFEILGRLGLEVKCEDR